MQIDLVHVHGDTIEGPIDSLQRSGIPKRAFVQILIGEGDLDRAPFGGVQSDSTTLLMVDPTRGRRELLSWMIFGEVRLTLPVELPTDVLGDYSLLLRNNDRLTEDVVKTWTVTEY